MPRSPIPEPVPLPSTFDVRHLTFDIHYSFVFLLLVIVSPTRAEDTVYIRPEQPGGNPYSLRGEIIDDTGRELTFRVQGSSRPRRYPADRVDRIETEWPAGFGQGTAAMTRGDFAAAAAHFVAANRAEKRAWARRRILAELVICYRVTGLDGKAGDIFLAIVQSDPATPAFDRIPLAWFATEAVPKSKAMGWLARTDLPAAGLLGASHLLATEERAVAIAKLRHLADTASDPRLAALAEAQRWRTRIVTADESDGVRWRQRIDAMPPAVRGGPYFILAQVDERLGQADAAALAYLRVPIHFKYDRPLAARALLGAARATRQSGHTDESRGLLQELIRDYPNAAERTEAEQMLESLGSAGMP